MKLFSWNVNGIRACGRKGFVDWLGAQDADVVCVQETKAAPEQLGTELVRPLGYHSYWHSSLKRGYSGLATYCRREPDRVRRGIGHPRFDREGRVLVTDFGDVSIVNAYFPNSQHDHARLPYKLAFCRALNRFLDDERASGRHIVLCGDHNIAHREIDLARPKDNRGNAGFLPQERSWMDRFTDAGWVDTFRARCPDPDHYTWWSYRMGVRERNIGWRLDYFFVDEELGGNVRSATIQPDVMGSDHCPVGLELA